MTTHLFTPRRGKKRQMKARAATTEAILPQFEAAPGVYVLVPPERCPVAIYTQQARALNLAWALSEQLRGRRIIVVGGGVAGATFAAGAAVCGAKVLVVEREFELLTKQLRCHHRFLHPRIHEWPSDKSLMASANLPILNWSLDTAHAVAERLLEGFTSIAHQTGHIEVMTSAEATAFDVGARRLSIIQKGKGYQRDGDIVVFAAGFGFDGRFAGAIARPYWRADTLDQPPVRPADSRTVLIVGDGDGAAIDVLRARLRSFDHGPFVDRFLSRIHDTALKTAVRFAERAASAAGPDHYAETLHCLYSQLATQTPLASVWEEMREQLRDDITVWWIARPPHPLSDKSFSFNRLLSWLLYFHKEVTYRSGTLASATFLPSSDNSGGSYEVRYAPADSLHEVIPAKVDEVIARYRASDVRDPLAPFSGLSRTAADAGASPWLLPEAFDFFADWAYRQTVPMLEANLVKCLDPVKIDGRDWFGYRLQLKVIGRTSARRAQYVLHPEQGEIIRRATAPSDFSVSVFTWDDYWVEAHLSDGTYVTGNWLSNLISAPDIRVKLREQTEILGGDYDKSSRPKANSRRLDRRIRMELTRAAHISSAPEDES